MEEFIAGTIHSFDGLADADGNPLFFTGPRVQPGHHGNRQRGAAHLTYYSLREIPAELERIGRACLETFERPGTLLPHRVLPHAAGEYVALEVNMRPPGGFTTDMFNYGATSMSTVPGRAPGPRLLRPRSTPAPITAATRAANSATPTATATRRSWPAHGRLILQVESVPGVFSSALGDVGYIFRAATWTRSWRSCGSSTKRTTDEVRLLKSPRTAL